MIRRAALTLLLGAAASVATVPPHGTVLPIGSPALTAQETHLLVVVGLGGDPGYRETFHGWASDLVAIATEQLRIPRERIVYLGERPGDAPELIRHRSTKENMATVLAGMVQVAGPADRVLVVLIGHGTGQGDEVRFNLPGPDLSPQELDVMLAGFTTQMVGVVNAASSSGPFVRELSGPNRVILTATRTAQERNETQFGGYFVEALRGEDSDADRNGRISLLEAFQYAQREVERYYGELNLLASEHAMLDDDGDGEGTTDLGEDSTDGLLAQTFWLGSASTASGVLAMPDSITDPELLRLYQERAELERRIMELRALRGQMEETRYEAELEELLVEMALKNREIRARGGGG